MSVKDPSGSDSTGGALRWKLPEILTVDEAAALLRVNRKTLYEVIRLNHPRWALRFGRSIRVSRTALLEAFRGKGGPALGDQQ
jgi:excisionase family DNA binding protein